jgi:hypothetical protein
MTAPGEARRESHIAPRTPNLGTGVICRAKPLLGRSHFREGGNPLHKSLEKHGVKKWIPAFAGMTASGGDQMTPLPKPQTTCLLNNDGARL